MQAASSSYPCVHLDSQEEEQLQEEEAEDEGGEQAWWQDHAGEGKGDQGCAEGKEEETGQGPRSIQER